MNQMEKVAHFDSISFKPFRPFECGIRRRWTPRKNLLSEMFYSAKTSLMLVTPES